MKPKGLQLDYLWRFKGLRFYVGWLHFKSKGFCMTKYGYWFMKVYNVCRGWKLKSKVLKTQGFMKIWIQCLWNRIPRLELANHNGLRSLVFPYCGHHSWWNLGWAKVYSLNFLYSKFEIHVFLKVVGSSQHLESLFTLCVCFLFLQVASSNLWTYNHVIVIFLVHYNHVRI